MFPTKALKPTKNRCGECKDLSVAQAVIVINRVALSHTQTIFLIYEKNECPGLLKMPLNVRNIELTLKY